MADPNDFYENQRQGIKNRIKNVGLQQNDVMARKFASMGGGPGGAEIKDQQLRDQNLVQQQEDSITGVNANEAHEKGVQQFQSSEAEKQRQFQGTEAQKARDLQSSQFGQNLAFQKEAKMRELDLSEKNFNLEKEAQNYNIDLSRWQKEESSNPFSRTNTGKMLGGLVGQGGGAGIASLFSDMRLKTDIVKMPTSIFKNVASYFFRYKDEKYGKGRRVGAMAQDLLETKPDAVIETPQGYMVDYSKLELK